MLRGMTMSSLIFNKGSKEYKQVEATLKNLTQYTDVEKVNVVASQDEVVVTFKRAADDNYFSEDDFTDTYEEKTALAIFKVLIKAVIDKETTYDEINDDYVEDTSKDISYYETSLKRSLIFDLDDCIDSNIISRYSIDEIQEHGAVQSKHSEGMNDMLFYFYCTFEVDIKSIDTNDEPETLAEEAWSGIVYALPNYDMTQMDSSVRWKDHTDII